MIQNRIIAFLSIGLGGIVLLLSGALPAPVLGGKLGPSFFPKVWAGVLILLGLVLLVSTWLERSARASRPRISLKAWWANYRLVAYVFLAAAGYLLIMGILGFTIGTLLFVPACLLILQEHTRKNVLLAAIVAVCASAGLYGFFYYGMHVFLPAGFWR